MGCTQRETTQRLKACHVWCHGLFHRLRQQRHSVGDASGQGIGCAYGRSHPRDEDTKVRFPTDAYGPFEHRDGRVQVTLAEGQQTEPVRGPHEAARMRNCFRNLQSFFPKRTALSEHAEFGVTHGEEGQGLHRRQSGLTMTLTALFTRKRCDGLPEAIDPLPTITLSPVSCTKVEVC